MRTLKDVRIGEQVWLQFDQKNGVRPENRWQSMLVTRSELKKGPRGQEYMLTRIGTEGGSLKLSISGQTAVIIEQRKSVVIPPPSPFEKWLEDKNG